MTEEANKAFYQECGEELELNPGTPCPNCGSLKRRFEVTASAKVGISASASGTHKQYLNGKQLAILSILAAIWLAILTIIVTILPFNSSTNGLIALAFIFFSVMTYCWQRYRITKFLRWIEERIGGQKTFK